MKNRIFNAVKLIFAVLILATLMALGIFAADLRSIIDIDFSKVEKIYFKCESDKDFTRYEVGDEMIFTFTLYADDEQISAPFFKYTMKGDDGQYSDGYADATSGTVVLKTKMTKPGAVLINLEAADYAKNVISNSKITKFEGGAIANALDINTTFAEPLDFDAFWAEQLELLDEYSPDLLYLEQVSSTNSNFDTYIVKVNCIGDPSLVATNATWTAGVLSVPKNAEKGTLGFNLTFLGYGVYTVTRTYKEGCVTFAVNSHSIEQLQPGSYYDSDLGLKNYGWKDNENASPYTCYFRWMLLRDVQAVRFLQKYFGTEGGETEFSEINTGAWKGLWNEKDIRVSGGSQGGFQALSVASLVPDVTYCEVGVPWMADVGSNTVSTRVHTNYRPNFAKGLLYFDSAFMAKRIDCDVIITAGMGDPTCPVYGVQSIYNNLRTDASIRFRQGQTHGDTNTFPIDFTHSKTASEISQFGSDAFYIIGEESSGEFALAWKKLTARDALICSDKSSLESSSADTKNIIFVVTPSDNFTSESTVLAAIEALNDEISDLGLDSYGFALVGGGSLSISAQAVLKMAADDKSPVYLLAFGNSYNGADELAINLSASVFDSQPEEAKQFKAIGTDGSECSSFIVSDNMSEISAYPVVTPLYELKNSGVSSVYLSPEETGETYGILKLSGAGVSKKIKIYDGEKVTASGNYIGFEWIIMDGILTVSGKGSINSSEYPWNAYISSVSEINLSEGVKSIGSGAFNMPTDAKIVLPYSLETIDENAFGGKTDFTVASYDGRIGNTFAENNSIDFESLGDAGECGADVYWRYQNEILYIFGTGTTFKSGISSFEGTDSYWSEYHNIIKKVVIGENITAIGSLALHNMSALTTVEMTRNVTALYHGAFESSGNITSIYYKGEDPVVGTADISSVVDIYIGFTFDGLSKIEKYILSDDLNEALLPEVFKANTKLGKITIPASVTAVGDTVFANCTNLNTVTILGMDTSISTYAFANKSSNPTTNYINNITIVAYEDSAAQRFAKTNLLKFRNIETGEEIDYKAFVGDVVSSGSMDNGISFEVVKNGEEYSLVFTGTGEDIAIGNAAPYAAFADKITKIIIRNGKNIGAYAFADMGNLKSVEFNAYVESLGDGVFAGCEKLSCIYIADTSAIEGYANLATVKAIGEKCFMGTAIESYTLSSVITEIPSELFKNSALEKADISKFVTSIGDEAFSGCTSLTDITMNCERYSITENAFYGVPKTAVISAYTGTTGENYAKENGFVFNSIGVVVHTVEGSINTPWEKTNWIFDEWTGVLTLTAGETTGWIETGAASSIGGWASISSKVTEIVIEGKYSAISSGAFRGMSALKKVVLPASGIYIYANSFNKCKSLETICMAGAPCIDGVADFSKVVGNDSEGNLAFGSNILKETAIKGIIIPNIYSDLHPIVESNLPEGLETIYGTGEYLKNYAQSNGHNFIPFGKITDTVYWKIESDTMTIFGNGSINELNDVADYVSYVKNLIIDDGITEFADGAFSELKKLENVLLPEKVTSIGIKAFDGCTELLAVYVLNGSEAETSLENTDAYGKMKYVFRIDVVNLNLMIGNTANIQAVICPLYKGDKTVVWTSMDSSVATVVDGIVTANSYGETLIYATFGGEYALECKVTVSDIPKTAESFLTFDGYQVRTESYNGLRSRFKVDINGIEALENQGYKVIEYGTLLASSKILSQKGTDLILTGSNGVYKTLDFATKIEIFKNDVYVGKYTVINEKEIVYYCTVVRFTENNYDMNVSIRGYAVLEDESGNEYVVYSDYVDEKYRSVNLYQVCVNLATEGSIDVASCISYIDVMNFKKSKEPDIGDVEITPDSIWK